MIGERFVIVHDDGRTERLHESELPAPDDFDRSADSFYIVREADYDSYLLCKYPGCEALTVGEELADDEFCDTHAPERKFKVTVIRSIGHDYIIFARSATDAAKFVRAGFGLPIGAEYPLPDREEACEYKAHPQ